ncbi:MAG TPA: conjugal transfer protein TraX [Oribacterium sp.]|nr:conjugal transfer protein TraX [Oribacterium sp.]HCS68007.1 conjugal transfer protein TraX [Oribacterium sp.]
MSTYQSVLKSTKNHIGLSGGFLKLFAVLMMTAYDFAVVIIQNGKLYGYSEEYYQMAIATAEGMRWLKLYHILHFCGCFCVPIFAFLCVEGFLHSSHFWKYFGRMLLLALLSEVPFDLCMYNETYHFELQNPVFSLALGLLVLYGMKRNKKRVGRKWTGVALGCLVAYAAHFQFGIPILLGMALMYNFHKEKNLQMACGALVTAAASTSVHFLPVLCFLPLWFYNGERGRLPLKWFYYFYYPLHLMLFYAMIYIGALL